MIKKETIDNIKVLITDAKSNKSDSIIIPLSHISEIFVSIGETLDSQKKLVIAITEYYKIINFMSKYIDDKKMSDISITHLRNIYDGLNGNANYVEKYGKIKY